MAGLGMVKVRVGMTGLMEWAIVAVLVLGNMVLNLYLAAKMSSLMLSALEDLDGSMARAIKQVIESGTLGDFEPVNPVQAAIAHFITEKVGQAPIDALSTQRGQDGKFAASE